MQTKSQNNAIVWSQQGCTHCDTAYKLLTARGYQVEIRKIGEGENYTKQDLLDAVPGARSVPQIFVNGSYVGDLNNLRKHLVVR